MVRQYVIPTAFAVALAGAGVTAQQPQDPPTQQPPAQQQPMAQQAETQTLEGCVYRAADIPGRAEGAGEDFVLIASAAGQGAVGTTGTPGATGAAAAPKVFKLDHDDADKLKELVGKRVNVTGTTEARATGQPRNPDMPAAQIELPELEVTTIAEATGGEPCPPRPEVKRDDR